MQTPHRLKKCIAHFLPLLVPLFLLMNLNAKSQSNVCPEGSSDKDFIAQPVLGMEKQNFEDGKKNYRRAKSKYIGKNKRKIIKYRIDTFREMLEYFCNIPGLDSINVYIGLYTKSNFESIDESVKDSTLTVFYSPQTSTNIFGYYWLPPKGKSFDYKKNSISIYQVREAERLYIQGSPHPMTELVKTLDTSSKSNYYTYHRPTGCMSCAIYPDSSGDQYLSDTRAMQYHEKYFVTELLSEIQYQNNQASTSNRKVKGIRVYFAENPRTNRLYLEYSFVKRKLLLFKRNFSIDEDANFCNRPAPKRLSNQTKMADSSSMHIESPEVAAPSPKILTATFDNGHMCPPACAEKPL